MNVSALGRLSSDQIQVLRNLIYQTNGTYLDFSELHVSDPEYYLMPSKDVNDPVISNTKVSLKALKGGRRSLRGEVILFYRRYDLNDLKPFLSSLFIRGSEVDSYQLLHEFNRFADTPLTENDVQYKVYQKTDTQFLLSTHPRSLIWTGSIEFDITFATPMITQRYLSGFQ